MCQSLGWGWEQARNELDIPRLADLNRYWAASPPVHQSVAAYLGTGRGGASAAAPIPAADETAGILDDLLPRT